VLIRKCQDLLVLSLHPALAMIAAAALIYRCFTTDKRCAEKKVADDMQISM